MCDFLIAFFGTLVGAAVTWLVSRFYYLRASKQLEAEVTELMKPIKLVLEALEEGKIAKLTRDSKGNPTAITLQISVKN
jgi:hypothetical protein